MATIKSTQTLAEFKTANQISSLKVFKSRKTGSLYTTKDDEVLAWVAPDLSPADDCVVHTMTDGTSDWNFICNAERAPEFTL